MQIDQDIPPVLTGDPYRLNQVLAAESEEAELVVAGRVVPLGPG